MTHMSQEDGIVYLDGSEQYRVTGSVTVRVSVSFTTPYEPHEAGFDTDLEQAVTDSDDWEIEDFDDLDLEAEEVEP